jgi:hypothetical protein
VSEVWSISEASRATGISRGTLHRMLKDGRLSAFEVQSGARRALRPEVRDFLLGGGCRPRIDSPWASWNQLAAPANGSAPISCNPECWDREDDWQLFAEVWGRWQPDQQLSDREFWAHVSELLNHWLVNPLLITPTTAATICATAADAQSAVTAGFRFDVAQWRRAAVLELLAEPPNAAGAAELGGLLERGEVPAELIAQVRDAVAAAADLDG